MTDDSKKYQSVNSDNEVLKTTKVDWQGRSPYEVPCPHRGHHFKMGDN